jgi:hypothetical protein
MRRETGNRNPVWLAGITVGVAEFGRRFSNKGLAD